MEKSHTCAYHSVAVCVEEYIIYLSSEYVEKNLKS